MFDLHSHLLPGLDDGATSVAMSLEMARLYEDHGIDCVACTPHILPGLYPNSGPKIHRAVCALQARVDDAGIDLLLVSGADNHIRKDFLDRLHDDHLLPIGASRYVLVELPQDIAPARLEGFFHELLLADYVPILTHPERLGWIGKDADLIARLAAQGVWMQVTSGALRGVFGRHARYWAERMLCEGLVHILASDAHDVKRRPPDLPIGHAIAEQLVGREEAHHLVVTRPAGVLLNKEPDTLPSPHGVSSVMQLRGTNETAPNHPTSFIHRGIGQRMRHIFSHEYRR
ncbi:MAG: tyrosine-protein phosphatase [Hyphomicrobiaceae bacterium]